MNMKAKFSKLAMALVVASTVILSTAVPASATVNHTVTFIYGTKVYKTTCPDGCNVLPPTDTYVPGYVFAGWVGNSANVKSDLTILGAYVPVVAAAPAPAPTVSYSKPTYVVKFVDGLTGGQFSSQTVTSGYCASRPDVPHHSGYHFDHFEGSYDNVTSDRTIVAIYERDYNDHDWNEDYKRRCKEWEEEQLEKQREHERAAREWEEEQRQQQEEYEKAAREWEAEHAGE